MRMTISGSYPSQTLGALADSTSGSDLKSEVAVNLLKKANDQTQQQGAALISMIEQAGTPSGANQFHLDTYA